MPFNGYWVTGSLDSVTKMLKSILIIKLSAIGDVVHTLPLLETLRKNFPDARIDWLVEEEAGQIIEGHGALDRLIVSQRKSWQKKLLKPGGRVSALKEIVRFVKQLRSEEYDLVIDLHGLFKSGLMTGLSRGRRKIGFTFGREGSSLFLTEKPLRVNMDQHAIERYLKTLEFLNCARDSWKGEIPISASDKKTIERRLDESGIRAEKLVAINPMARWRTKLWEYGRFAALADRLQKELSCKVIFTGSGHDRPITDRIIAHMKEKPLNLAGETGLKELAYLYSVCRMAITTDTGPMHIAAAMDTPVIALFGPTAPWRTGPYGKKHIIIREEMECSPCFRKKCDHMTCMKGITVERVFESARQLLI